MRKKSFLSLCLVAQNLLPAMKKLIFMPILLAVLGMFGSCTGGQSSKADGAGADTVQATVDTVSVLEQCTYPVQIEKVGNRLLVLDLAAREKVMMSFDLDSRGVTHFAARGHAENEVAEVARFHKIDEHRISIYKPNGLLVFNIASVCAKSSISHEFMGLPSVEHVVKDAIKAKDGFVALVQADSARFCLLSQEKVVSSYNDYPQNFVDKEEDVKPVVNYASRFSAVNDGSRFCMGTYIGGMLQTFSVDDDQIECLGTNVLYKSEYLKMENNAVSWDSESTIGFDDIYPAEGSIYALLNQNKGQVLKDGGPEPFTTSIAVFDWEASLKKVIKVGKMMMCLCVDENKNEAYAVHYGKDGLFLIRIQWK